MLRLESQKFSQKKPRTTPYGFFLIFCFSPIFLQCQKPSLSSQKPIYAFLRALSDRIKK